MKVFGLIGYPLSHSFSKKYFTEKFEKEGIRNHRYELFPLEKIEEFPQLLSSQKDLVGLNVTIPYKQLVMPYLDELTPEAAAIGAVNCIKIANNKLIGYNTDVFGFQKSLEAFLGDNRDGSLKALVLGTGGASKAIKYALKQLNIPFKEVSRSKEKGDLVYEEIDAKIISEHHLLVNTTPLGMSPNYETCPHLPYKNLSGKHFLYDLVYNPEKTLFLKKGLEKGAQTFNGLKMLYLQAEKGWEIWNDQI